MLERRRPGMRLWGQGSFLLSKCLYNAWNWFRRARRLKAARADVLGTTSASLIILRCAPPLSEARRRNVRMMQQQHYFFHSCLVSPKASLSLGWDLPMPAEPSKARPAGTLNHAARYPVGGYGIYLRAQDQRKRRVRGKMNPTCHHANISCWPQ